MKFGTFLLDLDADDPTAEPPTSTDCESATAANLSNFVLADANNRPFATSTVVGSLPPAKRIVNATVGAVPASGLLRVRHRRIDRRVASRGRGLRGRCF